MSPGPLDGYLVVSVEQAVAAPTATRKLADAGARVIKIERSSGDFARQYDRYVKGGSAYFVWLNRGKESCVLDIKDPDDSALLERILSRADVFVQNLGPGSARRAGLGSEELRKRHPRLITCDISGYGEEGEYARRKAYDNLLQAETGLQSVTGTPEQPARIGISLCDIGTGVHAYAAVVEALLRRERTGEGSGLKVSLFDAMADWMSVPYLQWTYGGVIPPRSGLSHPTIAPYGPYRASDGETVIVAVQHDREWIRFCEGVLERPELGADPRFATNPDRVEHRPELREAIQEVTTALALPDLIQRLDDSGIAYGRLRDVKGLAEHPQLRTVEIDTPHGPVTLPSEPVIWDPPVPDPSRKVPELGEHTEGVRREFGDGDEDGDGETSGTERNENVDERGDP